MHVLGPGRRGGGGPALAAPRGVSLHAPRQDMARCSKMYVICVTFVKSVEPKRRDSKPTGYMFPNFPSSPVGPRRTAKPMWQQALQFAVSTM